MHIMLHYFNMLNFFKKSTLYARLVDLIIILSALLISGVLFYQYKQDVNLNHTVNQENYTRAVSKTNDLIFGNPEPELYIVEYGDIECPFCQSIHQDLKNFIQGPWGKSGKVSWVWRHGFHINGTSIEKARVVECIREIDKTDIQDRTAWDFIEKSFVLSQEVTYPAERYRDIFINLGLNPTEVETCRQNRAADEEIYRAVVDIINLRIDQTPRIQFLSKDGELIHETIGSIGIDQIEEIVSAILKS